MKTSPYTRTKKPLNSDMNVVPYIDVMLVLLIIFMIATPMLTTGVDITLPKEQTKPLMNNKQLPVIVSLKADGSLFLSYDSTLDQAVNKSELIETLSTLAKPTQDPDSTSSLQVLINADANSEYRTIMNLMASLQQIGITNVGLLSDATNQP